jgi:translation elongation factor EF-G
MVDQVEEHREAMLDAVSEFDDDIMEKFLKVKSN